MAEAQGHGRRRSRACGLTGKGAEGRVALRRGSLGTAVRSHSRGDGGALTWRRAPHTGRTGPHFEGQRGSAAWSRPGARMRWAQASPPFGEGSLLGWSLACPGITPRRKTVPGLVPGRGQSEPHGPRTGPSWMASCKAVWFLSWAHPGDSGTLLPAEGACHDSHSTSKGLSRDGAGGGDHPRPPAHCWRGWQPELRVVSQGRGREFWMPLLRWVPARCPAQAASRSPYGAPHP